MSRVNRMNVQAAAMWVGLAMYVTLTLGAVAVIVLETQRSEARLKGGAIAACERANTVSEEFNERGEILRHFMLSEAAAKQEVTQVETVEVEIKELYAKQAEEYIEQATLIDVIAITDCEREFE